MTGDFIAQPVEMQALLHRVASSPQFQKSKRLRELLLYLGERALKDPNRILREQEIGVDVLGRPADYDTSHDTLVRVLISQLRKKLQEYFATDGRDEPYVLEIPKGNYLPVLRPRETESDTTECLEEVPPPTRAWGRAKRAAVGALVVLAAAAVLWPASEAVARHVAWRSTVRPTVEAFWTQLFANGQATYVVLSDVSLIEFEKLMGGPVRLSEYEAHEFRQLAEQNIADPVQRALAGEFVSRVTTAVSDVQAARDFGVIASECHLPLTIVSARDASSEVVSSMNTVLLGSWRANPWVGLFEDELNFRTDYYQETPAAMRFVNRTPRAGEQAFYPAEWRRTGYCRVAFLPNPRKTGNVLLISGSDVISTEAGARFIASEESMLQLSKKLGVKPGRPMPRFEVLLRTQIVNSTVPWFEMVAWRGRP
jgi:hypothetical protein